MHNISHEPIKKAFQTPVMLAALPKDPEFWGSWPIQMIIWMTVLMILSVVGYYVVGRFRGSADNDRLAANEMLGKFRELHSEGDIDDEEFRKIKSVLGPQVKDELKPDDKTA